MHYVYCLQDTRHGTLYYGYTADLRRQFKQHTAKNKNARLVYYEAYLAVDDARGREQKLKDYGQGRSHLKRRIAASLWQN